MEFWVGLRQDILECLRSNLGLDIKAGDALSDIPSEASLLASQEAGKLDKTADRAELHEEDQGELDHAIVRLTRHIISEAHRRGASDIHIEPLGSNDPCRIRFRIDGVCSTFSEIPSVCRSALISRLKLMAHMDIAERAKAQDGKIRFQSSEGNFELRVVTVPTAGDMEDVMMRILRVSKPLPLESLSMKSRDLTELRAIITKPYGICLCVGLTGSGKTTTLHSCIAALNTVDHKIWTVEDPVEITQPGLRQVQINRRRGITFASIMRSFLRADPDVIMIGEMRDRETAAAAIEASLTGHLVLSTLHTNSAPEAVTRLLDMGWNHSTSPMPCSACWLNAWFGPSVRNAKKITWRRLPK